MSLSPDGSMLAVVHHSGTFSLWDVPSLRLRHQWKLEDQPGFDEINPDVAENPKKRKQMKGQSSLLKTRKSICLRDHLIIFAFVETFHIGQSCYFVLYFQSFSLLSILWMLSGGRNMQ